MRPLTAVMAPFFRVPDVLRYSEDFRAAMDRKRFEMTKDMWVKIQSDLAPGGLALTQKKAEELFEFIEREASPTWVRQMSKQESAEWRTTLARRFLRMCRHIRNAHTRGANGSPRLA